MVEISEQIRKLTRVGTALTSEHDLDKLLDLILREARGLTNADAGSLYIKDGYYLRFVVSQNETLEKRYKDAGKVMASFKPYPVEISNESIAGFVANNSMPLNIDDVTKMSSELPYRHNFSYDEKSEYHTVSTLAVPMIDQNGDVLGVVQLINPINKDDSDSPSKVGTFNYLHVDMVQSLASQAAVAITNARLSDDLKHAYLDTIYRLSISAEYKDPETANHIKRMSIYSRILAKNLGMSSSEVDLMLYASPMHDIGKLGVPDAILLKPGKLNDEERVIMQNHTVIGANILEGSDSDVLEYSRVIALNHHEKWDGTGYPQQLKGKDIPLPGRIVALADVFDALTSKRPYRDSWPLEKAKDTISKDKGIHFDPRVAECFFDSMEEVTEVYCQYQDE